MDLLSHDLQSVICLFCPTIQTYTCLCYLSRSWAVMICNSVTFKLESKMKNKMETKNKKEAKIENELFYLSKQIIRKPLFVSTLQLDYRNRNVLQFLVMNYNLCFVKCLILTRELSIWNNLSDLMQSEMKELFENILAFPMLQAIWFNGVNANLLESELEAWLPVSLVELRISNALGFPKLAFSRKIVQQLTLLSCHSNRLEHFLIGQEIFSSMQVINCSKNVISHLPDLTLFAPNLRVLICSENKLVELKAVQLPQSLVKLNCSRNCITTIEKLPRDLEVLICDNNNLEFMPKFPASLNYLSCGQNRIRKLVDLPENLSFLDCSHNLISYFASLPSSLQVLICSSNKIQYFPELPNLTGLFCDYNPIFILPELPATLDALSSTFTRLDAKFQQQFDRKKIHRYFKVRQSKKR